MYYDMHNLKPTEIETIGELIGNESLAFRSLCFHWQKWKKTKETPVLTKKNTMNFYVQLPKVGY
jgi:hypothetical protein